MTLARHQSTALLVIVSISLGIVALLSPGVDRAPAQPAGPTLTVVGPKDRESVKGPDVTIVVKVEGTTLTRPDGSTDPSRVHLQYLLDGSFPQSDGPVPLQPPYVHSPMPQHTIKGLAPGSHTVAIQLAYGNHAPLKPRVQREVTFTVVP